METIGNRIKTERKTKGLTQEGLGKRVGVGKSSVSQWESGLTKNLIGHNLTKVATALGVNENWLVTGQGQKQRNTTDINATLPDLSPAHATEPGPEFVAIRYGTFKLQAGVVGFAIDYQDDEMAPIFFREDWLRSEGLKAHHLTACKITGDSMAPGLNAGDTVLIDTSQIEPRDGKVFAVNYEGELVIKRLIRDAGQWWLSSDNADKTRYPNKLCAGDLCLIIGQCVHKQSTMI